MRSEKALCRFGYLALTVWSACFSFEEKMQFCGAAEACARPAPAAQVSAVRRAALPKAAHGRTRLGLPQKFRLS